MHSLRPHERIAIDALLAGDHPALAKLRRQAEHVAVTARLHTGVGEHVDLEPFMGEAPVEPTNIILADVNLDVEGLKHGADALLFIVNGQLNALEFATAVDSWPVSPVIKGIGYYKEVPTRDEGYSLEPTVSRDPATLARALKGRGNSAA